MNRRATTYLCALMALAVIGLQACGQPSGDSTTVNKPPTSSSATVSSLAIVSWGPQQTRAGVPFNRQPNGSAAFWVHVDHSLEGTDAVVELDGQALHSAISGNLITASVPASAYADAGTHALHVTFKSGGKSMDSNDVKFVVR